MALPFKENIFKASIHFRVRLVYDGIERYKSIRLYLSKAILSKISVLFHVQIIFLAAMSSSRSHSVNSFACPFVHQYPYLSFFLKEYQMN